MGPPGFEPESQAPKAQRIDQATLRTHIQMYVDDILIIIFNLQVYKHYYYFNNSLKKSYKIKILKPRTGIEPATTRLHVSRSNRLSHRGNIIKSYNTIIYAKSYLNTLL